MAETPANKASRIFFGTFFQEIFFYPVKRFIFASAFAEKLFCNAKLAP